VNPLPAPFAGLTTMKKIKRILVAVAGVTVLAIGIALVVLPGPAFVVIPAGLAILAIEFAWARRWLRSTKDFAKRGARFFSAGPRDSIPPMKGATTISRRRLLPETAGERRAVQSGGTFTLPAADRLASIDAEALSRLEGEGGREAPVPSLTEVPLDDGIWRRPHRAAQGKQKKVLRREQIKMSSLLD